MIPPTRDEFEAAVADEMTGLLLAAYADAKAAGDFSHDGRKMMQQMRRGRALRDRIYRLFVPDVAPIANGKPSAAPSTPVPARVNGTANGAAPAQPQRR